MEQLVAGRPLMNPSAAIAEAPPGHSRVNGAPDQAPPPRREEPRPAGAEAQAMPGLDAHLVELYRRYAKLAGIAAAALGGAALIGWLAGILLLAALNPAWVSMKVNTAIAFLAAGAALFLAVPDGEGRRARAAAVRACAGLVAAIGLATLAEYVLGHDLGIDQWLVVEPAGAIQTMVPGRMAPATAISFALYGLALLAPATRRGGFVSTLLTLLVLTYSVLALTGYLLGAQELYSFGGHFTSIAFPTALAFLLLSSGLLVIGSEHGPLRWLASPRSGGVMLRRLLPLVVCVPLLIVWLRLQAGAAGMFTTVEFGAAAVGVANVIFLSCVLLWAAAQLDRSDAARIGGEASRVAAQYARSLIEASLDPLVTISRQGKVTDVNKATEDVTGRSRSELIGTDFVDYFTEPERARAGYEQVLSTGSAIDYPLAIRHVSGKITDVLYNANIFRDENGKVAGVFAAARDVTERNRAEDQLRASEQRYRMLVDTLNDGLLLIDEDLIITFINANFAQMLGYAEADIVGHRSPEFMHEASARLIPAAVARRKAGIAERYEITWVRRDGETVPTLLSARPIFDQDRRYRGSLSVVTDLTEMKHAEQELSKYRQHLEELVASRTAVLDGIRTSYAEFVIEGPPHEAFNHLLDVLLEVTASAYGFIDELFHRPDGRPYLVARAITDISWTEETRGMYEQFLAGTLTFDNMKSLFGEVVVSGKPVISNDAPHDPRRGGIPPGHPPLNAFLGLPLYLHDQFVGVLGLANRPGGYTEDLLRLIDPIVSTCAVLIGAWRIDRRRNEVEAQLRAANTALEARTAELDAANKELEAFSYSVSHDLRVPLRAIDGFSQILIEDYADKLDAEGQRVANVVRNSAKKMGRLIDDILAFSRVGRLEMAHEAVDMDALARAVFKDLEPLTAGRRLNVEIKPLPAAVGDLAMMQRVWTNLLDNAIKFTRPKEPATIEVGARAEGNEIVYYVRDNGVGFDMRYADKLFGVFQRLHGVDEFPGTGIGLAIVKRIITRHGGRVWAEGEPNEGATFYFALPAQENRNA